MGTEHRIDNPKDILLLLIYSPGKNEESNEPIVGRTRLVKMLFLFKEEVLSHFKKGTSITEDNFYEFFAWNFGPFSRQVYDDVTFFILRDFVKSSLINKERIMESVEEEKSWRELWENEGDAYDDSDDYFEEEFTLTEKGRSFVVGLYNSLSEQQQILLREFKKKTSNAPLRAILKYTYERYPEMTSNSIIKENIVGNP